MNGQDACGKHVSGALGEKDESRIRLVSVPSNVRCTIAVV